jgi:hypothetical protein
MSEAELHLIRSRLTAGLRHKAARGELRQGLPVGLDYDPDGRVVVTPDEAVREAIAVVFARFDEFGSARQVLLSLRGDGLLLPRRDNGSTRIRWAAATYPAVHDFLTNPAYAGAFVFGRTRTEKRVDAAGKLITRVRLLPREEWAVLIPDHHVGFINWTQYETNTVQLRRNWPAPRGHGGGAVREGRALLQGLLRCGRCGRIMQVGYSGTKGNCPRYVCGRAKQLYGGEHMCQSIGGGRLEKTVLDKMFAVLEPAALSATTQALTEADTHFRQRLAAFETAVERARFEADRARRQYDAVEPENRLVAPHPGTRPGGPAGRSAPGRDRPGHPARPPTITLTDEEIAFLNRAGADVRAVFDAPSTTVRERKQLIRAVITEVGLTVHNEHRTAELRIVWQAGAVTELTMAMTKAGGHTRATDEDQVALIRRLADHYDDQTIALILSKQGRRTGTGLPWTQSRVKALRVSRAIPARQPTDPMSDPQMRMPSWSASPRANGSYTSARSPSTGGCATGSSSASNSRPAPRGASASTKPCATGSAPTSQTGGSASTRPLPLSAWPAKPCCTRSNAANSTRSTSTAAAVKACVSRSNTPRLDCLTHPVERNAQC